MVRDNGGSEDLAVFLTDQVFDETRKVIEALAYHQPSGHLLNSRAYRDVLASLAHGLC